MTQSRDNNKTDPLPQKGSFDSSESQFLTQDLLTDRESELESFDFPIQMGHYRLESILGSGGMGKVFKAFDSTLGRYAAVKLLRAETPELTHRFTQEARVQAKIEHENVCKVYEVGEVEGKHFIAMQFIPGKTLNKAAKELRLEEKIRIVKQVADALHAAHREGLIHRDVKPSNIMVVRSEESTWKPYIMDFGLARESQAPGLTATGFVMGTVHYMSPEQALGKTDHLDRRTDVYALGATLYEILSGHTLFQGDSASEVLIKVIQEEPIPIRKMDPHIPIDLETIVMKCIEKEPQRRYESAKALSEDLQRFLDGDPIAARPIRWSERLVKKARKNRVAMAILSGAVIVTLILLGTMVWLQTKSSFQSRYAREFGEEVRSIESMIRSAYSAPLHDIRPEMAVARARLAKIENRTREAGTWAYGPGHNALGLGYFALDDHDKALENLKIAWQSNYREVSTAYALGKIMGIQYQRVLRDADLIRNKVLREEQKQKIEKEFRDPALAYLRMAQGNVESPVYRDGLIAFYEKRYSEALKKSIEAFKQAGWSYEAKKLEGDLYLASGKERENKGENEKSRKDYEAAGVAYRTAIELGRSRAEIYLSEAERWTIILNQDSEKGFSNEAALKEALRLSDQAIAINPDAPEGYSRKMKAYTTAGTYLMYNTGEDPRQMMDQAIAMGQQALKRNPQNAAVFEQTGTAYRVNGEYEIRHGIDPLKSLALSIQNYQKSLQIKPDNPPVLVSSGVAYSIMGEYELKHGKDPRPTFRKAIQQYQTSEQINPNYNPAYTNSGIAYWYMANYEAGKGEDPSSSFQQASQQYQSAIKMNPNNSFALFNLSLVYMDAGRHEMRIGRDPSGSFNQCLEALQKSAKLMNNAYVHSALGTVYSFIAEYGLEQNKSPTSMLEASRTSFQNSIKIDPSNYEPYGNLGRAETVAARWAMKTNESPLRYFQAARKAFQKSIELNKEEGGLYQMKAEMCRWEADWMQQQKRSSKETVADGLRMAEKALSFDSESADAYAVQGALYLLKAAEQKDRASRSAVIQNAQASLNRALQINRWLEREYVPLLKQANQIVASL